MTTNSYTLSSGKKLQNC